MSNAAASHVSRPHRLLFGIDGAGANSGSISLAAHAENTVFLH